MEQKKAFTAEIEAIKQSLMSSPTSASLPILRASEYGYRTVSNENLIAVQEGVSRIELKSTGRYKIGGMSVSIPIVKGVRYRVGSTNIKAEKTAQTTARGRLLITDKAIVFEGDNKNDRITWSQLANIELHLDGLTLAKRTGPPRTYSVSSPNPNFVAILEFMLSKTA